MGTRVPPSYANHFMGVFETQFIYTDNPMNRIVVYRRYIDDLFFYGEGMQKSPRCLLIT